VALNVFFDDRPGCVIDDNGNAGEPGCYGVMCKQVNDRFAVWANGGKGLDAAIAASTAGSQNEKRWFSHEFFET